MSDDVKAAEARAAAARQQMMATAQALKDRVMPATLADRAVQKVKARAEEAATQGAEFATEHPAKLIGAIGGVATVLLAWPLWKRFRRRRKATRK